MLKYAPAPIWLPAPNRVDNRNKEGRGYEPPILDRPARVPRWRLYYTGSLIESGTQISFQPNHIAVRNYGRDNAWSKTFTRR